MTRRRKLLAALAVVALGLAAALTWRSPGRAQSSPLAAGGGRGPALPPNAPALSGAGGGRSGPARGEVNAAGLARAASLREKERAAGCESAEGRTAAGCEPGRAIETIEVDWNGRRASP